VRRAVRVLLLAHDLGLCGGVGTFNYELAEALIERGVELLVIARRGASSVDEDIRAHVRELYGPDIPPRDVFFYLSNAHAITEVIKRFKPDVIHDASGGLGFLPWLSRYAPVVTTVHGSPLLDDLRVKYGSFRDWLRLKLYQYSHRVPSNLLNLFGRADIRKAVFVSKTCLADTLMRLEPRARGLLRAKSTVIYNGLSLERVGEATGPSGDCNEHDVVFMGRLAEYKGVDRLIRAFSHVSRELRDAKLHVVGSGPDADRLKALSSRLGMEKRVVFHGWLRRDRALKILASSALLVHPSLYESFGYVIVEAYALGKPVIAHRAPYSRELVEEMGAGLTVNTFDEEEFSKALLALLTDGDLYKRFSSKAHKVAEEVFDVRVTADKYIEVYEGIKEV
jgi:glycosyltransferase involved in cell wall biosynthesis